MSNLYRRPSIDAAYQVSVHLVKRFHRRWVFRNQPIRKKNWLWQPCLLMDQDEMSNLYRGPSIAAAYQDSVYLAVRFQRRRFFRNQPIRNKNCLWWPCLLKDRDEMSNLYSRAHHTYKCSKNRATWLLSQLTWRRSEGKSGRLPKIDPNFNVFSPLPHVALPFKNERAAQWS
jgi:hypothetical protein